MSRDDAHAEGQVPEDVDELLNLIGNVEDGPAGGCPAPSTARRHGRSWIETCLDETEEEAAPVWMARLPDLLGVPSVNANVASFITNNNTQALDEDDADAADASDGDDLLGVPGELEALTSAACSTDDLWRRRHHLLPRAAHDFFLASVRVDALRGIILSDAEAVLTRGIDTRLRDPALLEGLWRECFTPARTRETLRWLRRLRDGVVRTYHQSSAYVHARPRAMPSLLKKWRPYRGVLPVDDLSMSAFYIGYPPFLESTPAQIIRYVFEAWRRRALASLGTKAFASRGVPQVWDLTAGAGTGHDLLAGLFGCRVVSTDLTPCSVDVTFLDAFDLGTVPEHQARRPLRHDQEGEPPSTTKNPNIQHPNIILIDPPSRGTPCHADLYGGQGNDLASLDREDWLTSVVEITAKAITRLAPFGVVSLLVRHGVRDRGRVEPDDQLLVQLKNMLAPVSNIIEEIQIIYRGRVRQASLSGNRVPSTHLLLGRPS